MHVLPNYHFYFASSADESSVLLIQFIIIASIGPTKNSTYCVFFIHHTCVYIVHRKKCVKENKVTSTRLNSQETCMQNGYFLKKNVIY